jgi:hypothetical protein
MELFARGWPLATAARQVGISRSAAFATVFGNFDMELQPDAAVVKPVILGQTFCPWYSEESCAKRRFLENGPVEIGIGDVADDD